MDGLDERSYVLIYGDEVHTKNGPAFKGDGDYTRVAYRDRDGAIRKYDGSPDLTTDKPLELYFLDVGQGDAAFAITPNGTTILVDGGLMRTTTAEFLIWKYRLDKLANNLTIDHLFLSHADSDHVVGLIPILLHQQITVRHIWHNGLGIFASGFNEKLGNVQSGRLTTAHSSLDDLAGSDLGGNFAEWIAAVRESGATYQALEQSTGQLDIGDPAIAIEILGPLRNADGSFDWFDDHAHTINGHSLCFRMVHGHVRILFSGDLNIPGSRHLLSQPGASLHFDSHVFKSPHHGSHEYYQPFLDAVRPIVSVVSSGDSPDHGHPRAAFLGALGRASRSSKALIFSTEIAATFVEAGQEEVPVPGVPEDISADLMFSTAHLNSQARARFKKKLSGIINVRSNGTEIFAARRVAAGYQWESYDPISAVVHD